MIIAIDGFEANVSRRVGIGRYAYEILSHMYTYVSAHPELGITVRVYLPNPPRQDMPAATSWWQYNVIGPHRLWTLIALPFHIYWDRPRPSVVFSPTHYVPRFITVPRVMSIMDLSYLVYPRLFRKKDLHKLVHWTKYAVRHAVRILTISSFTRDAIIKTYNVPPKTVVTTYPGLSTMSADSRVSWEEIRKKYDIGKYFILSVGTIQPRKNYRRLIEAYSHFLTQYTQRFGAIDLVIVGKKGWLYEEILAAPQKYGVSSHVKFLHTVSDEQLALFYKKALCFALPSLYEGFGLPVLEAMANSCPVVVSNVSSLPEIAGTAGIYVDPKDVPSITKGLLTAVQQRNLLQGRNRIRKGLVQAQKFTWQAAAEQTIQVLMEAARSRV
jgi:glycosyltransferase involved in cell wall biosynthesis